MRLPIALFCVGLFSFFLTDYFTLVRSANQLIARQTDDPGVQAYIARLNDLKDGTTAPIEERRFTNCGYVEKVRVKPGFRIIHDTTLGREVTARGPKNALAHLELNNVQGRFYPDFDRPVKLKELVEIRINLQAHGADLMYISLEQVQPGRTRFQPDFVTQAPLSFQVLSFGDIPKHPVQIDAQDLIVYSSKGDDPSFLQGQAKRLEFIYTDNNEETAPPQLSAINLRVGETIHTVRNY